MSNTQQKLILGQGLPLWQASVKHDEQREDSLSEALPKMPKILTHPKDKKKVLLQE